MSTNCVACLAGCAGLGLIIQKVARQALGPDAECEAPVAKPAAPPAVAEAAPAGDAVAEKAPPAAAAEAAPQTEEDMEAMMKQKKIQKLGGDVNKALYEAVQWGDFQMAFDALDLGADPLLAHSSRKLTPLHVVAQSGNSDLLGLLLRHPSAPAMVEARNWEGETPLWRAVRAGEVGATQALVDARSDVNAADSHGHTPLWLAKDKGRQDFVDFLVANGATQ